MINTPKVNNKQYLPRKKLKTLGFKMVNEVLSTSLWSYMVDAANAFFFKGPRPCPTSLDTGKQEEG